MQYLFLAKAKILFCWIRHLQQREFCPQKATATTTVHTKRVVRGIMLARRQRSVFELWTTLVWLNVFVSAIESSAARPGCWLPALPELGYGECEACADRRWWSGVYRLCTVQYYRNWFVTGNSSKPNYQITFLCSVNDSLGFNTWSRCVEMCSRLPFMEIIYLNVDTDVK